MTLKYELIGLGVAAALALAGGRAFLAEHDARLKAEVTAQTSQKAVTDAGDQIKALQAQDAARQVQTQATIDAMNKLVAQVKTPQQIAQWLPQQVNPVVPQPITVNIPPATTQNPSPPAQVSVPQADLPGLRDAVNQCQQCALELGTAQADLDSKSKQLQQAGEQLSAMMQERDAWKKAAKGTFWTRLKGASEHIAIGGLIAVAAVCGSGHCK